MVCLFLVAEDFLGVFNETVFSIFCGEMSIAMLCAMLFGFFVKGASDIYRFYLGQREVWEGCHAGRVVTPV